MKKVGIMVCGNVSKTCPATGCFRAFNEKSEGFSWHGHDDLMMVAFNTCPGCDADPLGNIRLKMERFQRVEADTIHISTCIRSRCEHYEEFARILSEEGGFNVIGYTHGSEAGKKDNTIWIQDGVVRRYQPEE